MEKYYKLSGLINQKQAKINSKKILFFNFQTIIIDYINYLWFNCRMRKYEKIVLLTNISKNFGSKSVLSNINLTIEKGESIGLVGSNGAGKTTLLSLIQGVKKPSLGTISLFGGVPTDPKQRVKLGVSPQSVSLPDTFKVKELIEFVRKHYRNSDNLSDLVKEFHLEKLMDFKVGGLSGGQKRLLSICLAFSGNPELVLLDEPTAGLDFKTRNLLWNVVKNRNSRGTAIIVTSHYTEDIENLTKRIIKIDNGRIHIDSELNVIKNTSRKKNISLRTNSVEVFTRLPGVESYELKDGYLILKTIDSEKLIKEIVRTQEYFEDLRIFEDSLDDFFTSNTKRIRNSSK